MRFGFAAIAAVVVAGHAFAWDLEMSRDSKTGAPTARMAAVSDDRNVVAILKCRGGKPPELAFGMFGAEKPLPFGVLRAGYITYRFGNLRPNILSTTVEHVDGTAVLMASTDEDRDVLRLPFFMAHVKDDLLVSGADGSEWTFKGGANETRRLLSHCGIAADGAASPSSAPAADETIEDFRSRALRMPVRERKYSEKVAFRQMVQCAVRRIAQGDVPLPLSDRTPGDAIEGKCLPFAVTFMRFCTFNSGQKSAEKREQDCWDAYRAAIVLIDTGRRTLSDYDPNEVRF